MVDNAIRSKFLLLDAVYYFAHVGVEGWDGVLGGVILDTWIIFGYILNKGIIDPCFRLTSPKRKKLIDIFIFLV